MSDKTCEYCSKRPKPIIESDDGTDGIRMLVKDGVLITYGWYDGIVGISAYPKRINYCPMCGRELS